MLRARRGAACSRPDQRDTVYAEARQRIMIDRAAVAELSTINVMGDGEEMHTRSLLRGVFSERPRGCVADGAACSVIYDDEGIPIYVVSVIMVRATLPLLRSRAADDA
jgi:hypothetical protein